MVFLYVLYILILRDLYLFVSMTVPEENKEIQQSHNNTLNSWESDFSWLWNLKLSDLKIEPSVPNLISQINLQSEIDIPKEEVVLENLGIRIQPTQEKSNENLILGDSGIVGTTKTKYYNQYRRLFLLSFFVILVSGMLSIVLRLYSRYIYFASQPIPATNYQMYIDNYKKGQNMIDEVLHISSYNKYTTLSIVWGSGQDNVTNILADKNLSFVQKKDIIQKWLDDFSIYFRDNILTLSMLKENVSKYWFFPQELYEMIESQKYSTSIKKYLLSLEIIKFSSAIKVFSYLDTFVSSLANTLKLKSNVVQENMQKFTNRWEKDILVYLNNCYLNPYEIDYDCNMIGDFDRYYNLIDKENPKPDTDFFKKMMFYVDNKLEQTDLPSFSIMFKKYDPTQKQISFLVDVNTFKQDEIALIKKWIINPHIFILSNLLNLIKQSIFVVSENIDAKSIKIIPKTIKIGSSVYNVNNSRLDFVLPIQKWSEREISDYIDTIFTSSEE